MPHWFLVLGSSVGLITGIYTLFEKVLKQRPTIWLSKSNTRNALMRVRVRNRGTQDIAVIGSSVLPRIYSLSNSDELEAMIDAQLGDSSYRLIQPESTADLHLLTMVEGGRSLDNEDRPVWMFVFWRRTGSMWLPRIPLMLHAKTSEITRLSGAVVD